MIPPSFSIPGHVFYMVTSIESPGRCAKKFFFLVCFCFVKLIYTQGHQSTNESCINSKNTVRCLIYRNVCHLPAMHCIIIDFLTLLCVKALVHVTILLGSSIMVVFSFKKLNVGKNNNMFFSLR